MPISRCHARWMCGLCVISQDLPRHRQCGGHWHRGLQHSIPPINIYTIYIYWWWQVKAPTLKLGAHFGSGSPTDARSHITLWRLAAPPATKGLAGSPCSEYAKLLMPRAEFSAQDGKILRAKAMATNSCCWKLRCSPEIGASNSHQVGWVCLLALAGEYVPFLHVPNSATVRIHDFVDQALQGEPS